jgi:hypothetical protein
MKCSAATIYTSMDHQVPGGIYLCQVNENVSCGACCGLYNVADPSEQNLTKMLGYRTRIFETVPRNWKDIEDFGRQITEETAEDRPFFQFHHCPFIGLVGSNRSRVGCLLHPMSEGNKGIDFRSMSYYGGMACRLYFCPTFNKVPIPLKDLICHAASDWYRYGLIITESDLLCMIFSELASIVGIDSRKLRCSQNNPPLESIRRLMNLKLTWPFQPAPATDRVNYFFEDGLYTKPVVDYGGSDITFSRYDGIFQSLVSVFHTSKHLRRAETIIDELIHDMADLFGSACL